MNYVPDEAVLIYLIVLAENTGKPILASVVLNPDGYLGDIFTRNLNRSGLYCCERITERKSGLCHKNSFVFGE
jgi:hypothetical protein